MSKKIIILTISLFFLCGCDVTYNLEISGNKYKEKITIIENNVELFNSNEVEQRFYNNYTVVPIPMSKYDPVPTNFTGSGDFNTDEKGYYKAKELTDDNQIGMEYRGVFKSSNIADSQAINEAAPQNLFIVSGNNIKINSGILEKEFKQVPTLNKLTINITVKNYSVEENNADSINNNTYTWEITRNNYQDKKVNIEIAKSKIIKTIDQSVLSSAIGLIILMIVAISIAIFIYLFIKINKKKNNKF